MAHEPAILIDKVYKSFNNGQYPVLRGLETHFNRGELTYVLGPSGTGKSVLLKHLLGLLHPDQGRILVDHRDISKFNSQELSNYRMNFGVLFQNSALFDGVTVFENVAFPLREHTSLSEEEITTKVHSTLTKLGMGFGYDKLPSELSGGMKKRVGLARAIIREPSILLYDEPTTGLDPVTRTTVDLLIEKLKNELKLTSIVISHDIPSALLLADRIVFLFEGKAVFDGAPNDFKDCDHPRIQMFLDSEKRAVEALSGL